MNDLPRIKFGTLVWSDFENGEPVAVYEFDPKQLTGKDDPRANPAQFVSGFDGSGLKIDGGHTASFHRLRSDLPHDIDDWAELRRWLRYSNDSRLSHGKSGRRLNDRPVGGHFVAVDSEGFNVKKFKLENDGETYIDQRTFLWMAGGAEGYSDHSAYNPNGLSSREIFEFLLSLPRRYSSPDPKAKQPIFCSFAFGYDVAQIVKDLPYEKAWEIHNGKLWAQRGNKKAEARMSRAVLWQDFAISYLPRKRLSLYRLRNPDRPFKTKKNGDKGGIDWIEKIQIYDTFGFSQCSLVSAIGDFPGIVTEAELAIIIEGKKNRQQFNADDRDATERYTGLELRALVRMMEKLRSGLSEAIEDRPIKLQNWWGAGAIAQALLSDYLGTGDDEDDEGGNEDYSPPGKTKRAAALGVIDQESEPFKWSLHSYFGARIELLKQGVCNTSVNEIDVASAYPATTKELPSMKNGRWEHRTNLTRKDVENANILSMFHVRTHGFTWYLPFYPLPFRTDKGGIIFPPSVEGYYMRDDVIGAFKWFDKFEQQKHNAEIELVSGWIFHPASDEQIFRWVQDLFDYRAGLVKHDKKDIRGYVIKLGLNSLYGKFAQHVGERGNPPKFALPVFAGAITAGTRRKLIEAALTMPNDVIAFATDGVYSTKPLDVLVPETKQLGHWERKELKDGVFIQFGVNTMTDGDKRKSKTRGFTPNNLAKSADAIMREDVPLLWSEGKSTYEYPYTNYMTLGACVVTRKRWKLIGCWKIGKRTLEFDKSTNKRAVPTDLKWRQSRVDKLMDLPVNYFFEPSNTFSAPRPPDWLDAERENDDDWENVVSGLSF